MVKKCGRDNAVFIGLSLMLIAALGLAVLYIPKSELHLLLCNRHTPARDLFYRYYTQVAEWFPYIVCVALLFLGRIGEGVFASSAMLLSALTTQLFKHLINAPRPVTWFAEHMPDIQLPLVEGVKMNRWYSFPSGHTNSFFALAFVLCIIATSKIMRQNQQHSCSMTLKIYSITIQLMLFIAALLGGYSRIYLSQHFAADVLGGIVVGTLITVVCYAVFSRFETKNWYNYCIFKKNEG